MSHKTARLVRVSVSMQSEIFFTLLSRVETEFGGKTLRVPGNRALRMRWSRSGVARGGYGAANVALAGGARAWPPCRGSLHSCIFVCICSTGGRVDS